MRRLREKDVDRIAKAAARRFLGRSVVAVTALLHGLSAGARRELRQILRRDIADTIKVVAPKEGR